jgi:hypothetical protein
MSSSDVLRNNISNNIDGKNSSVDVLRIMDSVLDRLYDVAVKKCLVYKALNEDMLKHPEKYRVFNKNTPKPLTMKLIRTLGLVREQRIEAWLRNSFAEYEGYTVRHWNKPDDVDFVVFKNDVPFMAIEVKNYGEKSYMIKSTFDKIIERLSKYNCFKLLILTSGYNLIIKETQTHNNQHYTYYNTNLRKTSEYLRSKGIYTWILGYQDLMSMKQFDEIVEFAKRLKNKNEIKGWMDEDE